MASYTVARSIHKTSSAGVADTITLPKDVSVEVLNRSAEDVYFRADGTAAVAAADNTYVLLAGQAWELRDTDITDEAADQLSIISSGAAAYSVTVL